MRTEFQLLGPVEVSADGVRVDIGSAKQRLVLAALASSPGELVPVEVLIDRVWGYAPPGRPAATLYPYLSQLRRALKPAGVGIVRRPGGYVCEVPADRVDLCRFRMRLLAAKTTAGETTIEQLGGALALWHGVPLTGLTSDWVSQVRESLRQERLAAWLLVAEYRAGQGDLATLADSLVAAARDHPLSEPLAVYSIQALAVAGRRAEALEHYAQMRRHLAEELGEEPGQDLQRLHLRLLRHDPALTTGSVPPDSRSPRVAPRQLPAVTRHFVGRDRELRRLDELSVSMEKTQTGAIATIAGMAGMGKTTVAVRWAHGAADRFGDGQLFINLRGFDPVAQPMAPTDALRGFLEALGVAAERVPPQLEARSVMFRSLVADRELLVVLDNARDAEQVRPLLPGAPGCLTLVTSRNRLTGLVAEHGAEPIGLDLLSATDARQLLSRRLGTDRVGSEPEAVAEIVADCTRLPLALAVVAGRAAVAPSLRLADIAAELSDARKRLDALDTDDRSTTPRAVFSWSYDALSAAPQRLFRLLGLQPGPDISADAAASLAGLTIADANRQLADLCRVGLLAEHLPGRFASHDLLRAYATEFADTDPERRPATHRLFDHYLHSAYAAELFLSPHRIPPTPVPAPAQSGVVPAEPSDLEHALAWFATERAVLVATIEQAARVGFDSHVTLLADVLGSFLGRRAQWGDLIAVEQFGLAAARRLGDRAAEAASHRALGLCFARLDCPAESLSHHERALELYQGLGDAVGQAITHQQLTVNHELRNDYHTALDHAQRALELYTEARSLAAVGKALGQVGWFNALLGRHRQAIVELEQALDISVRVGIRRTQAATWDSLGYAYRRLGRHRRAVDCYQSARNAWREIVSPHFELGTLTDLGDAQREAGDLEAARSSWQEALELLDELDPAVYGESREKLIDRLAT